MLAHLRVPPSGNAGGPGWHNRKYVERDKGLYCDAIRTAEESGALAHVVWGNQCAFDASLDQLGQRVGLREWFAGSR